MRSVEEVANGFIVTTDSEKRVYRTLDEVFTDLLQHFEGRCTSFSGSMYGKVTISREHADDQ